MPDLNQCSFTGRLGRPAECREVGQDNRVANFSIAVDASYTPRNGSKVEKTVWLDCAAWNGLAGVVERYTDKGSRVAVAGNMEQDEWEDRQSGAKRTKLKLRVSSLVLLDPKGERQGDNSIQNNDDRRQPSGSYQPESQAGRGDPDSMRGGDVDEDSIPFMPDPIGGFGW